MTQLLIDSVKILGGEMRFSIYYPTPLEEIADIYNDNIDVCIQTDKFTKKKLIGYTFVIATIKNLTEPCCWDERGFAIPCAPILIVEKLTKEIIETLLEELFKDKALVEIYGKDL